MRLSGINPGFPGLSRSSGQIGHVLRTRSPLRQTRPYGLRNASLDLHALGAPPAFVLSQDQTLQRQFFDQDRSTDQTRRSDRHGSWTESCQCSSDRRCSAPLGAMRSTRSNGSIHGRRLVPTAGSTFPLTGPCQASDRYPRRVPVEPDRSARNGHSAFDTLFSCQGALIRSPCGHLPHHSDRYASPGTWANQ